MSRWAVEVGGAPAALEYLARWLVGDRVRVVPGDRGAEYLFEGDGFAGCENAAQVAAIADAWLVRASGVLRLSGRSHESLRRRALLCIRDDGTRDHFVDLEERACAADELDAEVVRSDGAPPPSPPIGTPRELRWLRLGEMDKSADKVLRLLSRDDADTWVNLYRVFEVLQLDVGGRQALSKASGVARTELDNFARSANSPDVAGDDARHGRAWQDPPPMPMSLVEAGEFVRALARRWLDSKVASAGPARVQG